MELVTPHLPETGGTTKGVVVIGAVQGDLHDIGYGLVANQLKIAGFDVHLLGVNTPSMTFIEKAQELDADIIGLSAFLVTTIPNCAEVVNYLEDMGLRDKIKVIIGGAETTREKAEAMGVRVEYDCKDDITAFADRYLLEQAFVNLLDNAIKYSEKGACVDIGVQELKDQADYITSRSGGHGAVREVVEFILKRAGKWDALMERYLVT